MSGHKDHFLHRGNTPDTSKYFKNNHKYCKCYDFMIIPKEITFLHAKIIIWFTAPEPLQVGTRVCKKTQILLFISFVGLVGDIFRVY